MDDFKKKAFRVVKKIPKGRLATYKKIALKLGNKNLSRAVGNALGKNEDFKNIPCHRIIKSDGRVGGYAKGTEKKISLLKREGIEIKKGKIMDFEKHLWK